MYTGGTPEAIKFIEKYKKTGHVVDFYSDEYIKKINQKQRAISLQDLKDFDEDHGSEYRGHLFAIYIGDENDELISELSQLYLPFHILFYPKAHQIESINKPDFILINLVTHEILCVGLGSKNKFFQFELHKYIEQIKKNDQADIFNNLNRNSNVDCSDEFFVLDHYGIAQDTLDEAASLGNCFVSWDRLAGNSDVVVSRNKSDGLYYFDDYDEEGMTKEEVANLKKDYEELSQRIEGNIFVLGCYYPNIEQWELKNGN